MKDAIAKLNEIDRATKPASVKKIRDEMEALRTWARASGKSLEQINEIAEVKVRAEWKGGALLREIERGQGERTDLTSLQGATRSTPYQQALAEADLEPTRAYRWQVMSWLPADELAAYFAKTREAARSITSEEVFRLGKKAMPHAVDPNPEEIDGDGEYSVVVIDPPWPMQKIEREVRPNQAGFDYPTMSEDEIAAFFRDKVLPATAADCHCFIWTTQRFLPMALRLLEPLGARYVLTMVWHKPGGFQPIGLPQYNCEFAVYARAGSPKFIDTQAFNCCFNAPRGEHSRKPKEFYETIRRVTDGNRIDVFSREPRDGFRQFGNETGKFAEDA